MQDIPTDEKIIERRLRRRAEARGLVLEKSRTRLPEACDYGTFHLVDAFTNTLVAYRLPNGFGLTLDDVERALNE